MHKQKNYNFNNKIQDTTIKDEITLKIEPSYLLKDKDIKQVLLKKWIHLL
ncbi:hypothetical protein [Methanosphaera sp. WGK6]|nr:hypothetical protein [Methanosphaera sp. WGK6]